MTQPSARVYIFLIGILGILILVFIVISIMRSKVTTSASQSITPVLSPTPFILVSEAPTNVLTPSKSASQTTGSTPTPIAPTATGGDNSVIPQGEISAAQQKGALLKIVPYSQTEFTVTFDYGEAKFMVTLNEPKSTNRHVFSDWRQKNYPLLTESDYFIIK